MKLSTLLCHCTIKASSGSTLDALLDTQITNISSNSGQIKPNGLFIAAKGLDGDGHQYIKDAFKNGACAVVAQHNPENIENVVLVEDSRLATAAIAAQFYNNPTKEMTLVGITGTNGKTTITWLIETILKGAGLSTGVIGTVNVRYADKIIENPYTTPDAIYLQQTLSRMKEAGVTHVVMEVSSHGLELNRVDYCHFDVGVFTNLTQDHMDFHKSMEDYFNCKKRLFIHFLDKTSNKNSRAVLNLDSSHGRELFSSLNCNMIGVSAKTRSDVHASGIKYDIQGLSGTLSLNDTSLPFCSNLTGDFNLENILCAAGATHALQISPELIKSGIEQCRVIPGRLEKVNNTMERHLFIDYAHTPNALDSVLTTLAKNASKRIITVFGCGGDRDRTKRPLMGQAACQHSNIAIVTSDNPRTENPETILADIVAGLSRFTALDTDTIASTPFNKGYLVEPDRQKAIERAVEISKPEDIILVAGKGHETYQITNQGTIHFDDKEELERAVENLARRFAPIAWTQDDISKALGCDAVLSNLNTDHLFDTICTDSRTIKPSQLFVALKGENFDAHNFVVTLAAKKIQGFIVQKGFMQSLDAEDARLLKQAALVLFETENTLTALGKLAHYQRMRAGVKVLALTGSSGKTTTRKITQQIFDTRFHTLATTGNLNNEIGVPLTLLKLSRAHEWAIVEMGMNHAGEISRLSRIARPDIAMVINTAGVHLEGLGTVENVARAKAEIFEGVNDCATAIIFSDDKRCQILEGNARKNKNIETILFFGSDPKAEISLSSVISGPETLSFKAVVNGSNERFDIPSPARFMVDNCLAAISAALVAGIDPACMKKGISAFAPVTGRLNITITCEGVHLIDDTYNANPASVGQALNTLAAQSQGNTSIAVLGDMLELGEEAAQLHYDIGRKAAQLKISQLLIFGPMGEHTIQGAIESGFSPEHIFSGTHNELAQKLAQIATKDSWVLVKGSRGMAMENVIEQYNTINNAKF